MVFEVLMIMTMKICVF